MAHKLTWIPDLPDHRDLKYRSIHGPAGAIPNSVDLCSDPFMPPVFDQGDLGACVENALAGAMTFLEAKEGNGIVLLSRLFCYWNARGPGVYKKHDTGSTIRDAIKGIAAKGIPLESLWPYDPRTFAICPPEPAWGEAAHRAPGLLYTRLETIADMMACLAAGYPFTLGLTLYGPDNGTGACDLDGLTAAASVLPLPGYGEVAIGGHALLAVGYDRASSMLKVRNSWGPAWGAAGYFSLPFAYATSRDLADDFWSIRRIAK